MEDLASLAIICKDDLGSGNFDMESFGSFGDGQFLIFDQMNEGESFLYE